ncbi:hypothetical protein [Streptomyces flaveolus]|uniref:hypothetical protein n=1 Tax=Streptomyces flaveolus TaxID=67297 RepID=UPI0037024E51
MYADDEGNCVYSGDDGYYEFDILAAGSTPADTGDAKPQGGSKAAARQAGGRHPDRPAGPPRRNRLQLRAPGHRPRGRRRRRLGVGTVRRRKSANTGATA